MRHSLSAVSRWLEQALERKKDSTFLVVTLANLREQQNRFDDASKLYERVIKLRPRHRGWTGQRKPDPRNVVQQPCLAHGAQGRRRKDALAQYQSRDRDSWDLNPIFSTRAASSTLA